jgi:hypothetical protein
MSASRRQSLEQVRQPQQVGDAEQASSGRQRQNWIRLDDARPRRGDRPQPSLLVMKAHSVLAPGLVPRDQFDLPAMLRVERMRDANDPLRFLPITCS